MSIQKCSCKPRIRQCCLTDFRSTIEKVMSVKTCEGCPQMSVTVSHQNHDDIINMYMSKIHVTFELQKSSTEKSKLTSLVGYY